jgi:hypothetical protein
VDVGGVAGQQYAAASIRLGEAALDTERRGPHHRAEDATGVLGQPYPEVLLDFGL